MIEFRCTWDGRDEVLWLAADIGGWEAGSVGIKELGGDRISVAQLHVRPEWRSQHVARRIMLHVLGMYPRAEAWLYAEPYVPDSSRPGPPREVLESFYGSLGFAVVTDGLGRRAMCRPADSG